MKLGIDIDGVLADFNASFIKRSIAVTGRDLYPPRPFDIPTWHYPELYGYTKDELDTVWKHITVDDRFWLSLDPYPSTHVAMMFLWNRVIAWHDDMYFITARPGVDAKAQTETWLQSLWNYVSPTRFERQPIPTVLITSHKGLAVQTLGLDVYIDDRWENALETAPRCRTFLMDRPWNRQFDAEAEGIIRVSSVVDIVRDPVPGNVPTLIRNTSR